MTQFSGLPQAKHRCAARGCDLVGPANMLMCPTHWRVVPIPLQRAVWRTYQKGQEVGIATPTRDYAHAVMAAVDAVAAHEQACRKGPEIQALTLRQPWATAIMGFDGPGGWVDGPKRIENRGWKRKVPPGGLWMAIHAGAEFDGDAIAKVRAVWPALPSPHALPLSAVLGVVRVRTWIRLWDPHAPEAEGAQLDPWATGPCCALIDDVLPLPEPAPMPGARGMWTLPAETMSLLQLAISTRRVVAAAKGRRK